MPAWIVVLLLIASMLVLGWLILIQFVGLKQPFEGAPVELLMACLALGILATGWIALILAEFGWFSVQRLAGIGLVMMGVMAVIAWRRRRFAVWRSRSIIRAPDSPPMLTRLVTMPNWVEYVFLSGWLVAATWLFFRPHEYILGGADAGVYVNLGASIARSGGILIDDPVLRRKLSRPRPESFDPAVEAEALEGIYREVLEATSCTLPQPGGELFISSPLVGEG